MARAPTELIEAIEERGGDEPEPGPEPAEEEEVEGRGRREA